MAQAFASQVAIAIETARLFDEVQRLAVTDALTGLYNRRGYTELGRREIERSRRYKRPLAAIMLDIDHFKQINDHYKHATGDEVLRELALRCRERLREIDILGRYGGEEFVLLLPETDLKGALHVAESLRERVFRVPFRTQAGALKVTISLGVAVYTSGEMDLEKLLDRADDAMYVAKQNGRNQVRSFDLPK
jgi:diguanylate cyclase (GGDEF)-like protein